MIWFSLTLLSILGAALMVMPLLRRNKAIVTSSQATPAVLLDQLSEIKRDVERGIISATDAQAAELEIKRRILIESRSASGSTERVAGDGRVTLILSAIFVPVMAVGYYANMGSPQISGVAFAQRADERQQAAEITELSSRIFEKLTNDPQGGPSEGWVLLGQTYSKMGRYEDAAAAFEVVSQRPEAGSAVFSMLAEALIYANQGVATPDAMQAVEMALALDAFNPAATFYMAVALSQTGEASQAYDLLVARLNNADAYAPWMESFLVEANRIGADLNKKPFLLEQSASVAPGPTRADIANAQDMTDKDRQAFITSMVARLASRLEDEPDDLDGWIRLGGAYVVLGDTPNATVAYQRAQDLLVNVLETDQRRQAVTKALADLTP